MTKRGKIILVLWIIGLLGLAMVVYAMTSDTPKVLSIEIEHIDQNHAVMIMKCDDGRIYRHHMLMDEKGRFKSWTESTNLNPQ